MNATPPPDDSPFARFAPAPPNQDMPTTGRMPPVVIITLVLIILFNAFGAVTNTWAWIASQTPGQWTPWLLASVEDAVSLLAAVGVLRRRYRSAVVIVVVFQGLQLLYRAQYVGLAPEDLPLVLFALVMIWYLLSRSDQLR